MMALGGVDAVVSHHMNPFRSGVARFNELLAEHLGVPLLNVFDERVTEPTALLLSFKPAEMNAGERQRLVELLDRTNASLDLFLHAWADLPVEHRLVARARHVLCGNHELAARLGPLRPDIEVMWTPGLLLDDGRIEPAGLTVFSFGMAHKMRIDDFRRLRELLEAAGRSYRVYVSAANHETASLADAELVFREVRDIFPQSLYFLGNLSDLAVAHYLETTTFFAAFFEGGVRANNTSVASALERGAVVITNLDRYSPPEYRHMHNLLDVNSCDVLPEDPLVLSRLRVAAMETGRARGWDRLVAHIRGDPARNAVYQT